jgi:hypothetical protein
MLAFHRRGRRLATAVFMLSVAACGGKSPTAPVTPAPSDATVAIMGASRLSGAQLAAWVNGRQPQPSGTWAATVPLATIAAYFIEEGSAEGVTGDVAFMQSIVETNWFRFTGTVPAAYNNFAGIGATDTNPSPAVFPDARIGVRAQIQHLRAYADPTATTCASPPLHNPCVDPRFDLVSPKGRAPAWNQMGNGNWATASTYASSILALYREALGFHGLH